MAITIKEEIRSAVSDWGGIDLTDAQVDEIQEHPDLKYDIQKFGVDTVVRGQILSFIARKLTGRDWPIYGEPQGERESFWEKLRSGGKELGYKVHPTTDN